MKGKNVFSQGSRCRFLILLAALLVIGDAMPAYSQTNTNEIRSGRGGVEFSKNRKGRKGSQYKSHRYGVVDRSAHPGIWTLGATAGCNYNWQTRESGYAYDMSFGGRWGASAGITATYMVYNWLSVRADVLYTQKNYGMERMLPELKAENVHTNYMNHYLQIPVMADWTFGGDLKAHIFTGAYAGAWLGGQVTRKSMLVKEEQQSYYEFTPEDNRVDGGLVGGVGVTYDPLPYLRVGAEVLFYYSLANTVKKQPVMNDTRYNNTIVIGVTTKYVF